MAGLPHHHGSGGAYAVDTMLDELSRQLAGNTKRYSRTSNGQQRVGNAMRIAKPGSANNSPRSSTMQSRRRTLIGDGFRGGLQTRSPAMDHMLAPTPAAETPSQSFYEREPSTRPARPLSWHPSSQNVQQSLFHQDSGNSMIYPYAAYSDVDILASLQHLPPTPAAVYSGYTSPAEPFSPLTLPYSNFSSQPMCSPLSQPLPTPQEQPQPQPQQQQGSVFAPAVPYSSYPSAAPTLSDVPYLPPPRVADEPSLAWEHYPTATAAAMLSRHTAPPTPEDFACGLATHQGTETREQHHQPAMKAEPAQQAYQPLIHDDENDDEAEGEILYGMGLYDAPDHSKEPALHQSVILSLLGSHRDQREADSGKGLGLKLEDAWEPPASDDEEEDEGGPGRRVRGRTG
ncbi:hypothetical protein NEMBOFW57_005206 [Staphylotrichum longicolle]|uniref:Uncharacterized protein n=1 Tax=Staphylotrichum longicolle TaxID=669026 RepID=A0AAD4EZW9_9PEZI|nr:hypothetical protein NEMBOFW57_005206 [Staphylotrichum longicolle]